MPKLAPYLDNEGNTAGYWFRCPACAHDHRIPLNNVWTFKDLDTDKPSVTPSLNFTFEEYGEKKVCHVFIHRGKLLYLPESTHVFKRRIAAMEELEVTV